MASQSYPDAEQSGVYALHEVDCIIRNDDEPRHSSPESLRNDFASWVVEDCAAAYHLHVAANEWDVTITDMESKFPRNSKRQRDQDDEGMRSGKRQRRMSDMTEESLFEASWLSQELV